MMQFFATHSKSTLWFIGLMCIAVSVGITQGIEHGFLFLGLAVLASLVLNFFGNAF